MYYRRARLLRTRSIKVEYCSHREKVSDEHRPSCYEDLHQGHGQATIKEGEPAEGMEIKLRADRDCKDIIAFRSRHAAPGQLSHETLK